MLNLRIGDLCLFVLMYLITVAVHVTYSQHTIFLLMHSKHNNVEAHQLANTSGKREVILPYCALLITATLSTHNIKFNYPKNLIHLYDFSYFAFIRLSFKI